MRSSCVPDSPYAFNLRPVEPNFRYDPALRPSVTPSQEGGHRGFINFISNAKQIHRRVSPCSLRERSGRSTLSYAIQKDNVELVRLMALWTNRMPRLFYGLRDSQNSHGNNPAGAPDPPRGRARFLIAFICELKKSRGWGAVEKKGGRVPGTPAARLRRHGRRGGAARHSRCLRACGR